MMTFDHPSRYLPYESSLFFNQEKLELSQLRYNQLIKEAEDDDKILGVILTGSRGKGLGHQYSDYDLSVIVDESEMEKYKAWIKAESFLLIGDPEVVSIQEVRQGVAWDHWARYGLSRLTPPVDKTGELTQILQDYHLIPEENVEEVIKGRLSAYINGIYRSIKSYRSDDNFASQYMCQQSIDHLLNFVFALDGRIIPYPKFMKWEAENFPLVTWEKHAEFTGLELLDKSQQLMKTGDIRLQQEIFHSVYLVCQGIGIGDQLEDEWGQDHIDFIRHYNRQEVNPVPITLSETIKDLEPIEEEIITALVNQVSKDEEVALILLYGSRAKRTHSDQSDIEFIAIRDRFKPINYEFIYKRMFADLWATNWDGLQEIAHRDHNFIIAAGTYVNAKIVYARSQQDLDRYTKIIEMMMDQETFKRKHLKKAIESYNNQRNNLSLLYYAKIIDDKYLAMQGVNAVIVGSAIFLAHLNQRYYTNNWGVNLHEAFTFDILPERFKERMTTLVTVSDPSKLLDVATDLVLSFEKLLRQQLGGVSDAIELGMMIKGDTTALSYNNKIRKALAKNDRFGLFYAIHDFQPWIMQDVKILDESFDLSTRFLSFNELLGDYLNHGFPDMLTLLADQDDKGLLKAVEVMETKLQSYFPEDLRFNDWQSLCRYLDRDE